MVSTTFLNGCRTTDIYCRPDCAAGERTKPENRIPFPTAETFFVTRYNSPLGIYVLASSQQGVVCMKTEDRAPAFLARWRRYGVELRDNGEHNDNLAGQLDAYFAGKRRQFNISIDLRGTLFQRQVWEALCDIPYGQTRSYGQIAEAIGRRGAARAVGRAVGTNPVSIVVPCHRVIGSNGELTGYGGGLERKAALLDLEARKVPSLLHGR